MRPTGKTISSGQAVGLDIKYQTITEEVELLAQAAVDQLSEPCATLVSAVRVRVEDRASWLHKYLLSSDPQSVFDETWRKSLSSNVPAAAVEAFTAALRPAVSQWRTLRVPVEIPLRRLLTTVHLTPSGSPSSVYEGRALSFDLELSTSLAWLGDETVAERPQVTYDLTANVDDWVVVGKKRGVYVADVSIPLSFMRSHLAIKTGEAVHRPHPRAPRLAGAAPRLGAACAGRRAA